MRALIIVLLLATSARAELITWEFGGDGWRGEATFTDGPPDFVSPGSGSLHSYTQHPYYGETIRIDFDSGYTLWEALRWRVQTADFFKDNESSLRLDASTSHTQILYLGEVVDEGYFSWGVHLQTKGRIFEPMTVPSTLAGHGEILQSYVRVNWADLDLPTEAPPEWHDMTYIADLENIIPRYPRGGGVSVPEPSTWAMCGMALACFAIYRRRRNRCTRLHS